MTGVAILKKFSVPYRLYSKLQHRKIKKLLASLLFIESPFYLELVISF